MRRIVIIFSIYQSKKKGSPHVMLFPDPGNQEVTQAEGQRPTVVELGL